MDIKAGMGRARPPRIGEAGGSMMEADAEEPKSGYTSTTIESNPTDQTAVLTAQVDPKTYFLSHLLGQPGRDKVV